MITVKQYAEERSITIQAVHQSMNGKRKKERLEGHVQIIDGVKWLDEEAVAILDEARIKSPIVYEKLEANEIIDAMKENEKQYLRKIAEQADEIAAMAKQQAKDARLLADATQNQLLLDSTRAELAQVRQEQAAREQGFAREIQQAQESAYNAAKTKFEEVAAQAAHEAEGKIAAAEAAQKSAEDKLYLQEQSEAGKDRQIKEKDRRIAELENLSPWEAFWIQFRKWMKGELNNGSEERSPAGDDTP